MDEYPYQRFYLYSLGIWLTLVWGSIKIRITLYCSTVLSGNHQNKHQARIDQKHFQDGKQKSDFKWAKSEATESGGANETNATWVNFWSSATRTDLRAIGVLYPLVFFTKIPIWKTEEARNLRTISWTAGRSKASAGYIAEGIALPETRYRK